MHREFLINIVFLVFINLLIKPLFIFGIDLQVQNTVAAEDYGLYFTLLSLACLFQILCDFGVQNFTNRHISQHPQLMSKYFPSLFALKLLLGALYIVCTPLVAWAVLGYKGREITLLFILVVNQTLIQMVFFFRSNISGLGHYRIDSVLSSLDKFLMLGTCGALLWGFQEQVSVFSFALAQTAALVCTWIIVFGWLRRKTAFSIFSLWSRNFSSLFATMAFFFRQSVPYALAIVLMTAYTRLDPVLLERMLPDGRYHADVYAGGYRLLDACNMFGYLFATLLLPMFARQLRDRHNEESLQSLVFLSFRLIWAASITLSAIISMCAPDLIRLLLPDRVSAYRWETLSVLIWAFVPVAVIYIFSTLLTANAQIGRLNRYFIMAIVLNVALNMSFIPHWQALGSALATLITQWFIALSCLLLTYRYFKWKNTKRIWIRTVLYAGGMVLAAWHLAHLHAYPWYFRALLLGIIGAAGSVFLFWDDRGIILQYFKKKAVS